MKEKFRFWQSQIVLSLAILFLSATAFAQTGVTISGSATEESGQPVANAVVSLKIAGGGQKISETMTNANGGYRFDNIQNGKYELSVSVPNSSLGLNQIWQVEINGQPAVVNLQLNYAERPSVYASVTIAAGTIQSVDEVSKSISTLENLEIRDRNEITVIDSLRTVPGLRVQQLGGFGRLANINIRGLRSEDTAVLIDGQRFRDAAAIKGDARSFLSELTVTNLSRVEVLRGSGSSLYGTNAVGGVFNLQTDAGGGKPRFQFAGEGGGLGFVRGRANFAGGAFADRFKYSFGLAQNYFGKGVDGDDTARNTSGQGRISFDLPRNAQISARFYGSRGYAQLNSNPSTIGTLPATGIVAARPLSRSELRRFETGTPRNQLNVGNATFIPDANDPDAAQKTSFAAASIVFTQAVSPIFNYSLSYQDLRTRRTNQNEAGGIGFQFADSTRDDGGIQTFRARADLQAGRFNLLTAGYEFETERYRGENFAPNPLTDVLVVARQRSNTFFVQDQIEADGGRLQISGAFRAQWFSLKKPRFTPTTAAPYQNLTAENPPTAYTADGSAAYFFRSTGTKIRAHVGNGYRVPSLYERNGVFFFGGFSTFGSPQLKPERSIAFDAGIDQTLSNNRVRLSATYFYTDLQRVIAFGSGSFPNCFFVQPDPFGRCNGYFNTDGGISRGGEFSAEIKPTNSTNIFTSYTFTKSLQREPQVAGSGVLRTLFIPEHQFSLVVTQRVFERLTLNFDFLATSSYLGSIFPRVYRFEGNRKGDLSAAYEIPTMNDKLRLRLFGTIDNIFNQDYYENGFRTARATARGGLQLSF